MRMFAQKHTARELAERAEVPILAGSPLLNSSEEALEYARRVGLPVLLKATGKCWPPSPPRLAAPGRSASIWGLRQLPAGDGAGWQRAVQTPWLAAEREPPAAFSSPSFTLPAGGGGGIGIHICRTEEEVAANFVSAARQGAAAFGDAGVFVEKYVQVRRAGRWLWGRAGGGAAEQGWLGLDWQAA